MAEVFEINKPHYNLRSKASHFKTEKRKLYSLWYSSSVTFRTKNMEHSTPKILEHLID